MPVYEYKCLACEHLFDKRERIENRLQPEYLACPECGEKKVKLGHYAGRAASIGDAVRLGIRRPDEGFKDVLREVHKNTPGSDVNRTSRYI